jgi:dienelactone hydrolase
MTRRLRTGALFLTFVFASSSSPFAARAQNTLAGHWEGGIIQPAGELKIVVDFTAVSDAFAGTFDLPDAAVFRWPLKVEYGAHQVRFRLSMGLLFEGELQGDTISGTVPSPTGGHTDPFYLRRKPAPALPYREEEVSFQSGGVTLAGTLRLPLSAGAHTAVFLLQGSGNADREAESFYADYYARHGLATLVYDKRGTGRSGGDYRQSSFDDYAADAIAGIHYLQSRPEIDPNRVGLSGRSHGGIVVPLAASLSKDVAFIINVSGAGVPPYQQMTYQAETEMHRDGFSEAEIAEAIAYMNLKWQVARAGGEGWDRLEVATRAARGTKWADRVQLADKPDEIVPSWKREMGYDPMPALERVTQPVLAVFGEFDTSTPVAATTANYRNALSRGGNKDYTITVFPGADHALLVWPQPGDQVHWPVLAPGYLEAMTAWIEKQVGQRR